MATSSVQNTRTSKSRNAVMSDPEDEYDSLPDIYSDIDFSVVPYLSGRSGCGSPSSSHTGTEYHAPRGGTFETGSNVSDASFDELDEAALCQLDAIEAAFMSTLPVSSVRTENTTWPLQLQISTTGRHVPNASEVLNTSDGREFTSGSQEASSSADIYVRRGGGSQLDQPAADSKLPCVDEKSRKRPRHDQSRERECDVYGGAKRRAASQRARCEQCDESAAVYASCQSEEEVAKSSRSEFQKLLECFEDEIACPICCDIFLSAYLCNPCGHSVCGRCGLDWLSRQSGKATCPVCRTKLSSGAPLLPNFSLDNAVEKHVSTLSRGGVNGWTPGGVKIAEWCRRKDAWEDSGDSARLLKAWHSKPKKSHRDRDSSAPPSGSEVITIYD